MNTGYLGKITFKWQIMILECNIQIGVAPSHKDTPTGLCYPYLNLGNHHCPYLQYVVQMTWSSSSPLWLVQGSALCMLNCFEVFIFTRDLEFLPKESPAIIQNTGQGAHSKDLY